MCADADFNSRFAELPKQLRLALLAIPSAAEQRQVLALVEETLDASRAEGELQFNLEVDFSDWTEGVEAFKHLKIEEIAAALGLNAEVEGGAPNFPFFNDVIDLNNAGRPWEEREREKEEGASQGKGKGKGKATRKSGDPDADTPLYIELRPYWHQWIAAVKMIINMMEGRNVLLMDSVGVGKTLQAVGMMAMYDWLRLWQERYGSLPPAYGTSCARFVASRSRARTG